MKKGPLRTDVRVRQCFDALISDCLHGESLQVIGGRLVAFQDACNRYVGEHSIAVYRKEAVKLVAHRISRDVAKALQEASEDAP